MRDSTAATRLTTLAAAAAATAAGLGAQQARADLVHTTVNAVLDSAHPNYLVDFRGDNNAELKLHYDPTAGLTAQKNIDAGPYYLTSSAPGQVRALSLGDTISPADADFTAFLSATPLLNDGAGHGDFAAAAGEKYLAIKLNAGNAAWVGFQTFDDASVSTLHATVHDFAYETNPNLSIAAGVVPEPSSLALLAGGAAALAAYRRRSRL